MNKFARLVMFAVWWVVGVDKISAEMHHQLAKELYLLVGGLEGQGTFVATPDVCRHYCWCFQSKSCDTMGSVCACQSDHPSFCSLFGCFYLLQRQLADCAAGSPGSSPLIIYFVFSQSALLVLFSIALHFL